MDFEVNDILKDGGCVGLAQINPIAGNLEYNSNRILGPQLTNIVQQIKNSTSDKIVFSFKTKDKFNTVELKPKSINIILSDNVTYNIINLAENTSMTFITGQALNQIIIDSLEKRMILTQNLNGCIVNKSEGIIKRFKFKSIQLFI